MTNLRHVLALNIRERRRFLGLSQAKLAESAGIATTYIAMIELEKKFPSVGVMERIAAALQIDPTELFSKTCFPAEAVVQLQTSVLSDFEQVVKNHIAKFEAKAKQGV
jgi:transcriptional regulator with XRE-family HTH domain